MASLTTPLFEQIGDQAAVEAAFDAFYRRVLADDRVSRFFEGMEMDKQRAKQKAFLTIVSTKPLNSSAFFKQRAKQKAFLTMAFGGPHNYTGKNMRTGHAHLVKMGMNDSHVDAFIELLGATLKDLGVKDELISQVAAIAESTRNDVLGR